MPNILTVIPARMASTRLPDKPLADICGEPMIVHVWRRAVAAGLGEVIVATDTGDICAAIEAVGGKAVMTRADHPSGSDRIHEALAKADPGGTVDYVLNLQGDLPTLDPDLVRACLTPLLNGDKDSKEGPDIATLAVEITDDAERTNPNVVKLVGTPIAASESGDGSKPKHMRALYFTRATAPYGDGPLYHHIGIYAYKRAALERFVALPPSLLERREKLEQLRALENDMRIDAAVVDTVPLGVDTPADLQRAREQLAAAPFTG